MAGVTAEGEQDRGMILEIADDRAVVLTPAGEFRRVPLDRPGRRVGEEMPLPAALPARRPFYLNPLTAVVAAAAVLLLVLIPSLLRHGGPERDFAASDGAPLVLAYVTVDINPSVELGIDAAGRVVTARALNAGAGELLKDFNYAHRPVDEVVDGLAVAAVRRGYLAAGRENAVVIAAVPAVAGRPVPEGVKKRVAAGEQRVRRVLREQRLDGTVGVIQAGQPRMKEAAATLGLSVGRYLIYLEMRKGGLAVDPEELRDAPVGRILKEKGMTPGEIIRRAEEEGDFDELAAKFAPRPRGRPGRNGDLMPPAPPARPGVDRSPDEGDGLDGDRKNGRDGEGGGLPDGRDRFRDRLPDGGRDHGRDDGRDDGRDNYEKDVRGRDFGDGQGKGDLFPGSRRGSGDDRERSGEMGPEPQREKDRLRGEEGGTSGGDEEHGDGGEDN